MIANIHRQPIATIRIVSTGAATAWPRWFAPVNTPTGLPRSRALNQRRTTLVQEGMVGASPTPSRMRHTQSCPTLPANPASPCASDHTASPLPSIRREPSRSMTGPSGNWDSA